MRQLSSSHSYEELRGVVVDVLLKRENVRQAPTHYQYLVSGVAEVLVRRGSPATDMPHTSGPNEVRLHQRDVELVRDVFWDLFRQGYVVLGGHDPNEQFRLSTFAEQTLNSHSPYRFHDTNSFISMVRKEVPDISPEVEGGTMPPSPTARVSYDTALALISPDVHLHRRCAKRARPAHWSHASAST